MQEHMFSLRIEEKPEEKKRIKRRRGGEEEKPEEKKRIKRRRGGEEEEKTNN